MTSGVNSVPSLNALDETMMQHPSPLGKFNSISKKLLERIREVVIEELDQYILRISKELILVSDDKDIEPSLNAADERIVSKNNSNINDVHSESNIPSSSHPVVLLNDIYSKKKKKAINHSQEKRKATPHNARRKKSLNSRHINFKKKVNKKSSFSSLSSSSESSFATTEPASSPKEMNSLKLTKKNLIMLSRSAHRIVSNDSQTNSENATNSEKDSFQNQSIRRSKRIKLQTGVSELKNDSTNNDFYREKTSNVKKTSKRSSRLQVNKVNYYEGSENEFYYESSSESSRGNTEL